MTSSRELMSSPTNTLAPSSASQLDNALASDVPMVDVRDLPSDLPPNDQPAVPSTAMSPTATPASSSIETNNTSIGAAHPLPHDSHQENRQSKPSVILSPSHQPILNWQSSGDSPVPGSDNVSKHRHGTANRSKPVSNPYLCSGRGCGHRATANVPTGQGVSATQVEVLVKL